MGEAIELYKQDGTATGIYYCSECRVVYPSKEAASRCHGKVLCACGDVLTDYYDRRRGTCVNCNLTDYREREAKQEKERFEKAEKIPAAEWDDWVYLGDEYYQCVEDALDGYLEGHEPEYVWAAKNVGLPMATIDNIIEQVCDGGWEDMDSDDLDGVDELEAAIAAFNEANRDKQVYQVDYSKAILILKEAPNTD